MKKTMISCLAFLVSLAAGTAAFAEVRAGAVTISPFLGGYVFDGVQHVRTNMAGGLKLGYNLTPHWGVEGQFTYVPLRSTSRIVPSARGDQYGARADILYHFMPEGKLNPFLALGGGWSRIDYIMKNDDATLDYGGGLKYSLNKWLGLRADVRHIFSFHGSYWSNFEYTAGLVFQLGGYK